MNDVTRDVTETARFTWRTSPEQMERVKARADEVGVSVNEWLNKAIGFVLDEIPVKGDRATAKKALEDFARSELVK